MKPISILFSSLAFFALLSCRKVIDLKVNDTDPKLVIEATFDAVQQKVNVDISKSINVFSSDTFPVISNAQVEIMDAIGVVTPLVNKGNGHYELDNYIPFYGSVYTMNVTINGTTYSSIDSLVNIIPIDTLTQDKLPDNPISEDGYSVFVYFTDPLAENYYRLRIQENGEWQNGLSDQYVFDDQYTNGNVTQMPLLPNIYHVNDTVNVRLISYSQKTYQYVYALLSLAGNSTSSPAPSNPPNEWTNNALGNFAAYGYDTAAIIIHP